MPLSRQGKDTPFSVLTANTLGHVSLIDKGNKKETRADLSRHGNPKQNTRGKCSDYSLPLSVLVKVLQPLQNPSGNKARLYGP
jgi:hypothetical protein